MGRPEFAGWGKRDSAARRGQPWLPREREGLARRGSGPDGRKGAVWESAGSCVGEDKALSCCEFPEEIHCDKEGGVIWFLI